VISTAGMVCFIIAFILMVNLPSNIADPIKSLTESIKQIANQNYKERVHFESRSEFGDLANSFNTMAENFRNILKVSWIKSSEEKTYRNLD
jgi:methyl-accepting chemotaxis protein